MDKQFVPSIPLIFNNSISKHTLKTIILLRVHVSVQSHLVTVEMLILVSLSYFSSPKIKWIVQFLNYFYHDLIDQLPAIWWFPLLSLSRGTISWLKYWSWYSWCWCWWCRGYWRASWRPHRYRVYHGSYHLTKWTEKIQFNSYLLIITKKYINF